MDVGGGVPAAMAMDGENGKCGVSKIGGGGGAVNSTIGGGGGAVKLAVGGIAAPS